MVATKGRQTVFVRDHDSFDPFGWAGGGAGLRGIRAPEMDVEWRDPYDYAALLAKQASLEVITTGPGPIDTSISLKKDVRNSLAESWLICRWDVDVRWQCGDRRDDPHNWETITRLCAARFLAYETDGDEVITRQSDDGDVVLTSPVRAPWPLVHLWRLYAKVVDIATSEDFTVVKVCESPQCADAVGQAKGCTIAIGTTGYYASSGLYVSTDNAETWTLRAITGGGGDVDGFACLGDLIVAVSAMDEEVGRSLDGGLNWGFVVLGKAPLDVAFVDPACVVVVGEDGYIWKSINGATSFSVVDAGVAAGGEDLYKVVCLGSLLWWAIGDNNVAVKSEDGAATWEAVILPIAQAGIDVTCVLLLDDNRVLVGYADGKLYLTDDSGESWEQDESVQGFLEVSSIAECGCGRLVMVGYGAGGLGVMYENIDAGAKGMWIEHDVPIGVGPLDSVACCGPNLFVAVGSGVYPTGTLGKVVVLS